MKSFTALICHILIISNSETVWFPAGSCLAFSEQILMWKQLFHTLSVRAALGKRACEKFIVIVIGPRIFQLQASKSCFSSTDLGHVCSHKIHDVSFFRQNRLKRQEVAVSISWTALFLGSINHSSSTAVNAALSSDKIIMNCPLLNQISA